MALDGSSSYGLSDFYIDLLSTLYAQIWVTVISWEEMEEISNLSWGQAGGSSLSLSRFNLGIEPLLRCLLSKILGGRFVPRVFADDVGSAFSNILMDLPKFLSICSFFSRASGLTLNFLKCVAVPLWSIDLVRFRRLLVVACPLAADLTCSNSLKYLGTYLGPGASDVAWIGQGAKLLSRTWTLKKLACGLEGSVHAYRVRAFSVLSHVAQFLPPSPKILKIEDRAVRLLTNGPYTSLVPSFSCNLKDLGFPFEVPSLARYSLACLSRVASNSFAFIECSQKFEDNLMCDFSVLAVFPEIRKWLSFSFLNSLRAALELTRKTLGVNPATHFTSKGRQASILKALRALPPEVPVSSLLLRRIQFWLPGVPVDVCHRGVLRFLVGSKSLPSRCLVATLQGITNSWNTISRMEHRFSPCIF